mgnify:CR=1 FL=1
MFHWIHNDLTTNIYIPLSGWCHHLANVLKWEVANGHHYEPDQYLDKYTLYNISKILTFTFKNHKIVGNDVFYTQSEKSNFYLSKLLSLITTEISTIYNKVLIEENRNEIRLISIEFLSSLGLCDNYMEFNSLLKGQNRYQTEMIFKSRTLADNLLKDKLLLEWDEQIKVYLYFCQKLFRSDAEHKIYRTKLIAYCSLFSILMDEEIYNIYGKWFSRGVFRKERSNIYNDIEYVLSMMKELEVLYLCYERLKFEHDQTVDINEKDERQVEIDMINDEINISLKDIDWLVDKISDSPTYYSI